jgi:hypothetical protein
MRKLLLAFTVLAAAAGSAIALAAPISANGTLYLTFDIGIGNGTEGILFGRLVPDVRSLLHFRAVTAGEYPGPVRYISFRLTKQVLQALVGAPETVRLSHGRASIIQIPVQLVLKGLQGCAPLRSDGRPNCGN